MRKVTLFDRVRYAFDNTMSQGALSLIAWLLVLSLVIVLLFSIVMLSLAAIFQEVLSAESTFSNFFWLNLGTVLAPELAYEGSWVFRLQNLIVAISGILLVSILIGLTTTGIEDRLLQLRKGRSYVIEQNHTVILGWGPQIFTVVAELVKANANQRRPVIAILGDADKVEMEDAVAERVGDLQNTRLVVRSGSLTEPGDLEIINPYGARSIIVLSPQEEDPDIAVIKTMLALTNIPNRPQRPLHIVTCLANVRNRAVAHMVGKDEVSIVMADDLIARLTVQTSLQAGLSIVYTDLFDFDGDEIYFKPEPSLAGKTFGEALLAYTDSSVIGLQRTDGQTLLNPPMSTVIGAGDQIIAIAADDDTIHVTNLPALPVDESAIRTTAHRAAIPSRRILILGWNHRAPFMISELNRYVAPGSSATIVTDGGGEGLEEVRGWETMVHLAVAFQSGDITSRSLLERLGISGYDQVLVLSDSDRRKPQDADARTLVTLLHLRDMFDRGGYRVSITSEMMDTRNRDLAAVTQADDFIISEKLVSLLLAQISENKQLHAIFDDLFGVEGSEIYLKPAGDYVETGRPVTFCTVVEAAARRGEVAIGYRHMAQSTDATAAYGVRLNPDKLESVAFDPADWVIVLAED